MNKKLVLTAGAIAILVVLGILFLLVADKPQMSTTNSTGANQQSTPLSTEQQTAAPQTTPGTYQDYSPAALANAKGTRMLFFYAAWCPQCRALEADIKTSGVPSGVTILKVNYDSAQDLRQKYGVTLQTTLVKVDDQGNLIKKFVAYGEPTLAAVIKNLL